MTVKAMCACVGLIIASALQDVVATRLTGTVDVTTTSFSDYLDTTLDTQFEKLSEHVTMVLQDNRQGEVPLDSTVVKAALEALAFQAMLEGTVCAAFMTVILADEISTASVQPPEHYKPEDTLPESAGVEQSLQQLEKILPDFKAKLNGDSDMSMEMFEEMTAYLLSLLKRLRSRLAVHMESISSTASLAERRSAAPGLHAKQGLNRLEVADRSEHRRSALLQINAEEDAKQGLNGLDNCGFWCNLGIAIGDVFYEVNAPIDVSGVEYVWEKAGSSHTVNWGSSGGR